MEQDRGGRRGVDEMREIQQQQQQQQQHHQRSGVIKQQNQENNQHHPPPQQPQKCPRCDSLNTKFCYYNNYSLSQPRFFCKTCRRYWTQGGTLRNVPVGGGCRKGKRLKRSSSSPENHLNTSSHSNSCSIPSVAPPLRNKGIDGILQSSTPNLLPIAATGVPPQPSMYYPGGGFLSSLAAFPSFNHQPTINVGGGEFGSSNLALLQGFSLPFHTQQQMHHHQQQLHQQHQQQQQQLYLHQPHNFNLGLSSSDDGLEEKVVVQPNKPSTSHQEWSQSFNPSSNSINTSEAAAATAYWSSNNTNTSTINTSTTTTSVSLNPTHWTDHHLSGYGPPPPPPTSTTSSSSPSFL